MWSKDHLVQELGAAAELLQCRKGSAQVQEGLLVGLQSKFKSLGPLTSSDLACLFKELESSGLTDDMKASLASTLEEQLVSRGSESIALKVQGQPSSCENFARYLTQSEVDKLKECSPWQGVDVLVARARMIGIRGGVKENTKKMMTALLLSFQDGQKWPTDAGYELSQFIAQQLSTCKVASPSGAVALAQYPANPRDLSEAHYLASYPTEKPAVADFPSLGMIFGRIRVRSKMATPQVQHTVVTQQTQQGGMDNFALLASYMKRVDELLTSSRSSEAELPGFKMLGGKTSKEEPESSKQGSALGQSGTYQADRPVLALPAPEAPQTTASLPTVQFPASQAQANSPDNDQCSMEDLEKKTFAKLMKRPAACPNTKKNAGNNKPVQKPSLKLGCKKCRGSHTGCSQCKNPAYSGLRMNRSEWKQHASLHGLK